MLRNIFKKIVIKDREEPLVYLTKHGTVVGLFVFSNLFYLKLTVKTVRLFLLELSDFLKNKICLNNVHCQQANIKEYSIDLSLTKTRAKEKISASFLLSSVNGPSICMSLEADLKEEEVITLASSDISWKGAVFHLTWDNSSTNLLTF